MPTPPEHPDHDEPEQLPELAMWDDAARAGAIADADAVMRAFAQPSATYEAWWAGLAPLLSSTAQEVYSSVDPSNIPVSLVTGPGVSVDESTPSLARVEIPTDAGTYTILLSRDDADPTGWVAEKIQPPEQP